MKTTAVIAITGMAAGRRALVEPLLEHLADQLRGTPGAKLPLQTSGGIADCLIDRDTIRIAKLHSGQDAILAEIDLPDDVAPELPEILRGRDVTEADRAAQMPVLEEQLEQGTPE